MNTDTEPTQVAVARTVAQAKQLGHSADDLRENAAAFRADAERIPKDDPASRFWLIKGARRYTLAADQMDAE